jgi:hypothetical protein
MLKSQSEREKHFRLAHREATSSPSARRTGRPARNAAAAGALSAPGRPGLLAGLLAEFSVGVWLAGLWLAGLWLRLTGRALPWRETRGRGRLERWLDGSSRRSVDRPRGRSAASSGGSLVAAAAVDAWQAVWQAVWLAAAGGESWGGSRGVAGGSGSS